MEFERYRDYLRLLVDVQVGTGWKNKIDLSGIVQQTLLEAHQASQDLQNKPEPVLLAWLRQTLANNMKDEMRKLQAAIRNIFRERSLEDRLAQSSVRIEGLLQSPGSSPSHRLIHEERILLLMKALSELGEEQRMALEMHHLQGQTLADVAEQMGKTKASVASLVFRGLRRLREILERAEQKQS